MSCGIYKYENKITGEIYIGQSVNIERRHRAHKNQIVLDIDKAIQQYGIDNFTFSIIEECSIDKLNEREKFWINYYDSYNNGYNNTLGGTQNGSVKLKMEQVLEIIKLLKTTNLTNQEIGQKYNVSENLISGINTGYYWKQIDQNYPIRSHKKNKIVTQTKYPPKEELQQILIENKGNFTKVGKIFGVTDNSIRKICKKYQIPTHSKDYKNQLIKKEKNNSPIKIAQCDKDTGEILQIYNSITEAEQKTGIYHLRQASDDNNIQRKTAGGYIWKRI